MFKPLLRTMPSLTGNVKLVCVLNNYELVDEHIFEVNVRTGQLLGLSSQLFNKYINVSLLNSSYQILLYVFSHEIYLYSYQIMNLIYL